MGSSPTKSPTPFPTRFPTRFPTKNPTKFPTTEAPTKFPTENPTKLPTESPTFFPTVSPTSSPTDNPTEFPTQFPTGSPTQESDIVPTVILETVVEQSFFEENQGWMSAVGGVAGALLILTVVVYFAKAVFVGARRSKERKANVDTWYTREIKHKEDGNDYDVILKKLAVDPDDAL